MSLIVLHPSGVLGCPAWASAPSGGGKDQEPAEDVGGAGLGGDDGVVLDRHQGNCVSTLQL